MSRVERVAAHAGQIHALLQRIINECDAAQTEVLDYLNMRDVANKQNEKLKAENERLRELAAEAIRLMQANGPDCGICEHYDECWTGEAMDYSPSGCVICNEARELGIEVDG